MKYWPFIFGLLAICQVRHVQMQSYFDKCHCPQIDVQLKTDQNLIDTLHETRRQETKTLPIYVPSVVPNTGVPPVEVLAILDPQLTYEERKIMTLEEYSALKSALAQSVQDRITALATNDPSAERKKREATPPEHLQLKRSKRALGDDNDFPALLLPEDKVIGIRPIGGLLSKAVDCRCASPTSKVRKILEIETGWIDGMDDMTSDAFKDFKISVEKKIDDLYTNVNSHNLLEDGYGGSTVVTLRKKSTSGTTTITQGNTTMTVPNARIEFEIEIPFAGRSVNSPAPKNVLDDLMSTNLDSLGFAASEAATDAFCLADTRNLNPGPPAALETSFQATDRIPARTSFPYTCVDKTTQMIPFDNDPDSNFEFELNCIKGGTFQRPNWPPTCVALEVCTGAPSAPSGFTRVDSRTKFRVGEKAYFACTDHEMELDDDSGMNVYELPCGSGGVWDTSSFPSCRSIDHCSNLPEPSPESKLRRKTEKNMIKKGEYVTYECIDRDIFYETPNGVEMQLFCNNPVTNGEATMESISSWPVCQQLPCVCLGKNMGLDLLQSKNVLERSCLSSDNYVMHNGADGNGFVVPKRVNCGTYKPLNPNWDNRCECSDLPDPISWHHDVEVTSFTWNEQLNDASSEMFTTLKSTTESAMNRKYLENDFMMDHGFLRAIVTRFKQGTFKASDSNANNVYVAVELQFKGNSSITDAMLRASLPAELDAMSNGNPYTSEVAIAEPGNFIAVETCFNDSLTRMFVPDYKVFGSEVLKKVGEYVEVKCAQSFQMFNRDLWDKDNSDNVLTIVCKPDRNFNTPITNLPDCWSKCSGDKPEPPSEHNLILDTDRTSSTEQVWQTEEIWYKCKNSEDGLEVLGPTNVAEGSDQKHIGYICNPSGSYEIPTKNGELDFKKCLPRPRRCVCLGDFDTAALARQALDLFCRNDTFKITESEHHLDPAQIIPSKDRCGSVDPVDMTVDTKCHCQAKEKLGAEEGIWMALEIVNIPFKEELLDFGSKRFLEAKYMVEKALDETYLNDEVIFSKKFIRTKVMRFEKGQMDLLEFREFKILEQNEDQSTPNATTIDDLVTNKGDPIVDLFAYTEEEIETAKAIAADLGEEYEPLPETATMVHLEVQFMKRDAVFPSLLKELTLQKAKDNDEWLQNLLWINPLCFTRSAQTCYSVYVPQCSSSTLDIFFTLGYLHDNMAEVGEEEMPVPVGAVVNIFCEFENERIDRDEWDDDPTDFKITTTCKPDTNFDLVNTDYPNCRAWCKVDEVPEPPPETGLTLMGDSSSQIEYWEGEAISYVCNDTSLGVDASDSTVKKFICLNDKPIGKFNFPRVDFNETWPVCRERTTTIKPNILEAMQAALNEADRDITDRKTEELYISQRNQGDVNYYLTILLPCLILLALAVFIILCCTRIDNPLCKYCSKSYGSLY